jgi:cellulose synthase/poly-beta-1,6-N-acetylglucosamine synthase-like glycosyltransferase
MISMLIAEKGYRIVYEPEAYATETASENVSEELKRKDPDCGRWHPIHIAVKKFI